MNTFQKSWLTNVVCHYIPIAGQLLVMSAVVCPEARGLLEAEPAQRAVEVLLLAVEELVLLESRLAEESCLKTSIRSNIH